MKKKKFGQKSVTKIWTKKCDKQFGQKSVTNNLDKKVWQTILTKKCDLSKEKGGVKYEM